MQPCQAVTAVFSQKKDTNTPSLIKSQCQNLHEKRWVVSIVYYYT